MPLYDSVVGVSDTLANTPFSLTAEERRLRAAYQLRWAFYLGIQNYINENEEESIQVIVNYCRAFSNKINDYMFSNVFRYSGNSDLWPFIEPIVTDVWSGTDRAQFGTELGQMGGVTGDAYVKIWWDTDPYSTTYNTVQFSVIPSSNVIPKWVPGRTGKDRKMSSCRIVTVVHENNEDGGEPNKVVYTTVYYTDVIQYFKNSTMIESVPNVLGEIPIVHIQNQPLSGECHGVSDIEDILGLQDQINDKVSSIASVIHYHGSPLTLAYGIKKSQIAIGENRILFLPKKTSGVDVSNLDRQGNIRESVDFLNLLKEYSHEMSSVPEASLGKMQPISNTSGVALHMQYQPIVHIVNRKKTTYGPGFVEMTRIGLKMYMLYNPNVSEGFARIRIGSSIKNADNDIESMYPQGTMLRVSVTPSDWRAANLKVEWPEILPKDTLMELEMARSVQSMGLVSDRLILEKIIKSGAIDLPVEGVDEYINDARTDQMQKTMVQMGMYGGYGGDMITGQTDAGPGSGSAMQSPQETVRGSGEDQEDKE